MSGVSLEETPLAGKDDTDSIEDLPTRPLMVSQPEPQKSQYINPKAAQKPVVSPVDRDAIEHFDTVPLVTYVNAYPVSPPGMQPQVSSMSKPSLSSDAQSVQDRPTLALPTPLPAPVQSQLHVSSVKPSQPPTNKKKSRTPLLMTLALLVLLLLGSVGAWIWFGQPFSDPKVTFPEQQFKDTALGMALLYPNGWLVQKEQGISKVHFYDSSHTA